MIMHFEGICGLKQELKNPFKQLIYTCMCFYLQALIKVNLSLYHNWLLKIHDIFSLLV